MTGTVGEGRCLRHFIRNIGLWPELLESLFTRVQGSVSEMNMQTSRILLEMIQTWRRKQCVTPPTQRLPSSKHGRTRDQTLPTRPTEGVFLPGLAPASRDLTQIVWPRQIDRYFIDPGPVALAVRYTMTTNAL